MSFFEEIIIAANGVKLIDNGYCICGQLEDEFFADVKVELMQLDINVHCVDKSALLRIWKSDKSSFTKIASCLLWGGIRGTNLSLLKKTDVSICDNILKTMSDIISETQEQKYWEKLRAGFEACSHNHQQNNCHLNGVNEAFFTKFFHFYAEANKESNITKLHPVIGDQWIRLAICADMISCGYDYQNVFVLNNKEVCFAPRSGNHSRSYVNMVKYYNERIKVLKRFYKDLTPFSMESLLFGQAPVNGFCPRCRAKEIILTSI